MSKTCQCQIGFESVKMAKKLIFSLCFASLLGTSLAEISSDTRNGKIFSLFSVVQFKNSPCVSTSTLSTGQSTNRNGTCYAQRYFLLNNTCTGCDQKNHTLAVGICLLELYDFSNRTLYTTKAFEFRHIQIECRSCFYEQLSSILYATIWLRFFAYAEFFMTHSVASPFSNIFSLHHHHSGYHFGFHKNSFARFSGLNLQKVKEAKTV